MSSNDLSTIIVNCGANNHLNCYINEAAESDTHNTLEARISSSSFNALGTILSSLEAEVAPSSLDDQDLHLFSISKMVKKDFHKEIRGLIDVKHYLNEMIILLNHDATNLYSLVEDLIEHMKKETMEKLNTNEILNTLFTDHQYKLPTSSIQGVINQLNGSTIIDQSWTCLIGSVVCVKKRIIGLVRTNRPLNFGISASEIRFVLLILTPNIEKMTKNCYELGRTFATLMTDKELRHELTNSISPSSMRNLIKRKAREYAENDTAHHPHQLGQIDGLNTNLWENITRRSKHYCSDFADGILGGKTLHKILSTTMFLYFSCLLPAIAFGVLNSKNTNGLIGAERALIGQALGGILFVLIAGQPLVIIGTTALVSLYIKVVYEISNDLGVDFFILYASVGFWNTIFVLIYSFCGWSKLIKYSTRSVEEIFAMFITFCFFYDAIKDCVQSFQDHYFAGGCLDDSLAAKNFTNLTENISPELVFDCKRENSLLFLILMLATLWLSLQVFKFNQSPYLPRTLREFVADYALPIGVITFSYVGSFVFSDVKVEQFEFGSNFNFQTAMIAINSWQIIAISIGLGFALSILFFMDQNITGQIVNSPSNNLKKGSAPHLDLLAIAIINCILSFYGIPWMHGILPHSPLHVQGLADVEERNNGGCIQRTVVKVRETRLTGLLANLLIALSLFMVPYPLNLIPVPVLDGLFLYCAFASLRGSSFFERIMLLFQEQASYPPNHYIRHVKQKIIHFFTFIEIIQLIFLIFVGFAPWAYVRMAFPLFIALLIPIRHLIIPAIIGRKSLKMLDLYG